MRQMQAVHCRGIVKLPTADQCMILPVSVASRVCSYLRLFGRIQGKSIQG